MALPDGHDDAALPDGSLDGPGESSPSTIRAIRAIRCSLYKKYASRTPNPAACRHGAGLMIAVLRPPCRMSYCSCCPSTMAAGMARLLCMHELCTWNRVAGTAQAPSVCILNCTAHLHRRHGAGAMNSLFMREGSTFVELRPFEFGTKYRCVGVHQYCI